MLSTTRVVALCLVACLALLVASAAAAAAPKAISGTLSKPGYTVIALAADGEARTAQATQGSFKLRPPARRVTLQLRASDGTYAGPIVLAETKRAKNEVRRARRRVKQAERRVEQAKRTNRGLTNATERLRKASDSAPDRPASTADTFSFTLNITKCIGGAEWRFGEDLPVMFRAGRRDRSPTRASCSGGGRSASDACSARAGLGP